MKKNFLSLLLLALPLGATSIAYDPFELEFNASDEHVLAFVKHEGVKLLEVSKDLEKSMFLQLEGAKKHNHLVTINFLNSPNIATTEHDLIKLLFVSNRRPSNQNFIFSYKDIKYNKKLLFGVDNLLLHCGDKWLKIGISKPGLMEEIAGQIDFAKKYKKDVSVNIEMLRDAKRQIYARALAVIKIIDS